MPRDFASSADYLVDCKRVVVAGLSAGAAMAVIVGKTYPDVFAAVGAHSGLPFGGASDVGSAFSAMSQGTQRNAAGRGARATTHAVPTIVLHGDADRTVAASNSEAIVRDATAGATQSIVQDGIAPADAATSRKCSKAPMAGHGWNTGPCRAPAMPGAAAARGTCTDPAGPDASAEMVRLFLKHGGAKRDHQLLEGQPIVALDPLARSRTC